MKGFRHLSVIARTASVLAIASAFGFPHIAAAQTTDAAVSDAQQTSADSSREIIVTGSRIRRSVDDTASTPVSVINADNFPSRGFIQAGQALDELTSNRPSRSVTPGLTTGQAAAGADFPNLFNLGPARTLTLVNGRRTVSTSLGLGDEAVDTNIIPIGLLDRIEVVQGGGAAVYGSGAIGGVVNYVLKKHFEGVQADFQSIVGSTGDYNGRIARLTVGQNFGGGRGNIAAEFDYSHSSPLLYKDRPNRSIFGSGPNPAPGAGKDGIPVSLGYGDATQYVDVDGLVVTAPLAYTNTGVLQSGGKGYTIDAAGNIQLKDLGTPIPGLPYFATGSQLDWPYKEDGTLQPGMQRIIGSLIGHYDITDNLTFSTELLYARTRSRLVDSSSLVQQYIPVLGLAYADLAPLPFTKDNPYLSAATVAALSAANPGFAAGEPLYLSKNFSDIDPLHGDRFFTTTTYRAEASLDGNFHVGQHRFDYELSYSHGEVTTDIDAYAAIYPNFRNAADVVRDASGNPVCAINAVTVVDPACVPFNIFGTVQPSKAVESYIVGKSGLTDVGTSGRVKNYQDDILATITGDVIKLPGGMTKFSATYEHRSQRAKFLPLQGDLEGLYLGHVKSVASAGAVKTDEFAAELDVPLVGDGFTLPLVKSLDVNGSYRYVDSSIAGSNSVYGVGGRWLVGWGFTVRASRSRNFRAPSINQVSAPASITLGGMQNPCSKTLINSGPAPSTRAANCLALFTANPTFGLANLPTGVADTPANRLANFVGTSTSQVRITTAGNPDLKNEISNTFTYGFVFQPPFVPGLTITADRIDLKIGNALALFSVNNFATNCFDSSPQPANFCNTLTYDANGDVLTGTNTTVNAGKLRMKADTFNIDYRFPLNRISASLPGALDLTAAATHNRLETTLLSGTLTQADGTVALPHWSGHFEARYKIGGVMLGYAVNYLSSSLLKQGATVENSVDGIYKVKANYRHDLNFEIEANKNMTFRFGVLDLTDEKNSYPVVTFGDVVGRRFFVGVSAKL